MWCSKYLCILAQDVCLPDKIRMCICMRKMLTLLLPGVLGRENQCNCIDFIEPAPDLHHLERANSLFSSVSLLPKMWDTSPLEGNNLFIPGNSWVVDL